MYSSLVYISRKGSDTFASLYYLLASSGCFIFGYCSILWDTAYSSGHLSLMYCTIWNGVSYGWITALNSIPIMTRSQDFHCADDPSISRTFTILPWNDGFGDSVGGTNLVVAQCFVRSTLVILSVSVSSDLFSNPMHAVSDSSLLFQTMLLIVNVSKTLPSHSYSIYALTSFTSNARICAHIDLNPSQRARTSQRCHCTVLSLCPLTYNP
jgi:hypothetical protein